MRYTSLFNRSSGAEWVPPMLKPAALVSLAVLSFAVIAALEILRHYTVAQVLSPNNGGILFSARYLPTLVFIALGYIVKGVASDLKKVTPWANMSGRWASGSHTVLLDYISALEIVAVFSAMRRKDWAVFIGLVCTFICGALVPLANALAYVDLFAPRNITATFTQTSAFRFDNSPLVMANGSLTIPWNTTGTEPYARAISGRLGGAPRTLWTAGNYAFDQFSVPSVPNATATTEVNSIAAGLDCQRLRYSDRVVPDIVGLSLEASPDDLEAAGCNAGLEIEAFISPQPDDFSYPRAWLNITQCSDHADDGDSDRRILATYLSYFERPNGTIYYNGSSVTGLLCSPRFTSQMARLSVNSTTSEITAFEVSSEPQPLDIKTSTEALWIYLQNPLDSDIQKMFGRAQLVGSKGVYDPATRPVANMANITYAMEFDLLQRDPFMQVALQGHPENVFIGHDVFQREVTEFAGKVWAEVISFLARSEASNELPGRIAVTDERILLRNPVVRTCQALLAFLGIVAILCALRGRPKTVLEQDPGSLAAASVILSASDAAVEREMAKHSLKSTQEMATDLRSTRFMLRKRNAGQQPGVTVDLTRGPTVQDPEEMVDMNGYQPAPEDRDSEGKGASLDGWRPLPLRLVSKVALEVAAAAVMIGLGIMLWQSDKQNGLCVDTPVSSAALTLSASTVLVIFGYCFAGVDAAAQAQAPFNVLRKRPNNLTIFTDDLTLLGRLSGLGSGWMNITLLASAASYILIIPAMKLVAAGLFSPVNTQVVDAVSVQLDTSMTTHLEQVLASPSINRTPVIKQACDFAEWETNPVFNLRPRPGIVGNLVLDNLTAVVGTKDDIPGSVIEARVPAIAVDIQCEPTPSSDFNLSLSRAGDHAQGMKFAWACTTERCDKLNSLPGGFFAQTDALSGEIPSYSGEVSFSVLNESSAKQSDGIPASGSVYSMYIADLTSLGGSTHSFRNMTPLPSIYDDEDENTTLWATPDTLNVTLPPVVATHCRRNLTIVDVNATFTRPTAVAIESGAHLLPWRPISIDVGSIQYARPFPDLQPEYFQPPRVEFAVWGQVYDDDLIDGKLQSNSLWPARGSSQNFYELLAADAQHRAGNLSRLLTPAGLADSATRMYTAYCTQILSELRTFASNDTSLTPSAANQTQTVPARLVHSQLRVHQDAKTTYILLALLGTVACFALLVFCRFPSAAILPKEPGSIASRFSLLADSTLVRQLRQDKVSDVNEMRKWREPAALGWWRNIALTGSDMSDRSSTSTSTSGWRWGVDIGQHAILQSWKDPPNSPHPPAGSSLGSPSPSQSSTPSSLDSTPMLPELPFQRGVDEVPVTEMNSQRSSVSSIDIDILHDRYREHPSESDTFSPDSELYT